MDTILVCSFTTLKKLYNHIENLKSNYDIVTKRIFVFENVDNIYELFCTFNIPSDSKLEKGMIPIHRKSQTNTLYTINSLNIIVSRMNNGVVSDNVDVPWENYRNTILLTDRDGGLKEIQIDLNQIINIKH